MMLASRDRIAQPIKRARLNSLLVIMQVADECYYKATAWYAFYNCAAANLSRGIVLSAFFVCNNEMGRVSFGH